MFSFHFTFHSLILEAKKPRQETLFPLKKLDVKLSGTFNRNFMFREKFSRIMLMANFVCLTFSYLQNMKLGNLTAYPHKNGLWCHLMKS